MGKNKNRRRQLIVNEPLQKQLILTSMWMPCLCLAALSGLLTYFCIRLHNEAIEQDADLTGIVPILVVAAGFVVVAITFTVVHGVRLSHRIAGPVVNFDRTLKKFMAGETAARIRLRKLDLLLDAADCVNVFLEWTEQRIQEGADTTTSAEAPEASETATGAAAETATAEAGADG